MICVSLPAQAARTGEDSVSQEIKTQRKTEQQAQKLEKKTKKQEEKIKKQEEKAQKQILKKERILTLARAQESKIRLVREKLQALLKKIAPQDNRYTLVGGYVKRLDVLSREYNTLIKKFETQEFDPSRKQELKDLSVKTKTIVHDLQKDIAAMKKTSTPSLEQKK